MAGGNPKVLKKDIEVIEGMFLAKMTIDDVVLKFGYGDRQALDKRLRSLGFKIDTVPRLVPIDENNRR